MKYKQLTLFDCEKPTVWAFGGGTQTAAIAVLVVEGVLPKPDFIIMADTSREARKTWDYKRDHLDPLLAKVGLKVEVAPHSLASSDIWSSKGTMLMPAYTENGKLSSYCSGYWKRDVNERFLRSRGFGDYYLWLGMSADEKKRAQSKGHGRGENVYPLIDLNLDREACVTIVEKYGLPTPPKSSCYMCPHRSDEQWADLKSNYPDEFEKACQIDEEIREVDIAEGNSGLFLYKGRVPLKMASFDNSSQPPQDQKPCESGFCFV